jgi:hypothetical protein
LGSPTCAEVLAVGLERGVLVDLAGEASEGRHIDLRT